MDRGVVGVLALVGVLEESEKHVDEINENIGADHALPEVPRVAHLSQEVEEEHRSTVSVDDRIDTLERTEETGATRREPVRRSVGERPGRNRASNCPIREVRVTKWSTGTAERAQHNCIIRARSGTDADSHEGSDYGGPDREVGKPSEALQRPNLAKDHAQNGDDEQTDDEAHPIAIDPVLPNRDLRDRSTETEDQHSHQHEHLETLQNIDQMSHFGTEDAEEGLSKVAEWVAVGIHVHVHAPDVPARNRSHETENGVESATRPVAIVGERPSKDRSASSDATTAESDSTAR